MRSFNYCPTYSYFQKLAKLGLAQITRQLNILLKKLYINVAIVKILLCKSFYDH